jgi:hypothetical protein
MRALAAALMEALGTHGPILMYTAYEKGVIEGLATLCPDLADGLNALIERLVDLAPIARDNYYHPDMRGSWSLKSIIPTIDPELDYQKLEGINHGTAASAGYLEAIAPGIDEEHRAALENQLLRYCAIDTKAMVRLVHYFQNSPPGS